MTDSAAPAASPRRRPDAPRRRRRWLRALGWGLLGVVLLLGLTLGWLLGTSAGLRFALARAVGASHGALAVDAADGRLLGPLGVTGLRYRGADGLDVRLARAQLDVAPWALLAGRLHVRRLDADGIVVALPPSTPSSPDEDTSPPSLQPPLDIRIDRAHVGRLRISQGEAQVFASDRLDLAGRWTAAGLALTRLELAGPDGSASLRGSMASAAPAQGQADGRFDWRVGDTRLKGTLTAHSDGRQASLALALSLPATARLQLTLDPAGDAHPWSARLDLPRAAAAALLGEGSAIGQLGATLDARGDRHGATLSGELQLDDTTVQLDPLRLALDDTLDRVRIAQLRLRSPQIPGTLEASGQLDLAGSTPTATLDVRWREVSLPAALVGQPLATAGSLQLAGSTAQWHARGALDLGPPGQPNHLQLDLDGTPAQITVNTLALEQARGGLDARGRITLQPALAWQLDATAKAFDPGQLAAGWTGAVDAALDSVGRHTADGLDATLSLKQLGGTLRQRALRGKGTLHLSPRRVLDGSLSLASGDSRLTLEAAPGPRNDADIRLAIASLGDWLPDAGGRLDGHLTVRGDIAALGVNGTVHGERLAWQAQRLDALDLVIGVPDIGHPSGKLVLDGRGLLAGGLAFDRLHLLAEGSQPRHALRVQAQGRQLSAQLALDGSLDAGGGGWRGTLTRLELAPQGLPSWQLQQPTALAYRNAALRMDELCLTAGEPLLCASATQDAAGALDARYRLRALPLALILNAAGMADLPMRADGNIEGDGDIHRSAGGSLSGQATLRSAQGVISYTDHADQPLLAYRDLALQADLDRSGQRASLHAALNDGGRIDGELAVRGDTQALDGTLALSLRQLGIVELLTSEVANVKGSLDGRFRIGGTLAQPALGGEATLAGFAGEVPAAGLKLTDGRLTLSTADARIFRIDGQLHSGEGTLAIGGSASLGGSSDTELTLKGDRFTAVDIPAAQVVMSPDLVLRQGAQGLDITGRVALDRADVDVSRLPGAGATQASPDVVVVDADAQRAAATTQALPVSATVAVDLGRRTHLKGFGLDGRLSGQLQVRERPGRATTGQGQLDVSGTYRAYGQNLVIEQGRLLFASTPVDNPRLDIRAVRRLNPNATVDEGQKVGLNVTGTAQRPVLTVFSQPVMEQSDALSYLITGKPLSEVKGGEGSMVNSAAQALGSAGGDLLAKRIGSQLGVDDIGVSSSDALGGGSAFTVGKYLSPRLYLSYGVGLFEPGEVITLRYRLSKRWNFEAQNATDFSRASFNYRLER